VRALREHQRRAVQAAHRGAGRQWPGPGRDLPHGGESSYVDPTGISAGVLGGGPAHRLPAAGTHAATAALAQLPGWVWEGPKISSPDGSSTVDGGRDKAAG
jgi:hypothetical protein